MIGNKPGKSAIAPTVNEENLANKRFLFTEMIPSQAVMHCFKCNDRVEKKLN